MNASALASESPSSTTTRQEGFQRWRCWLGSDLVPIARQHGSRRVLFCRLRLAVESYQRFRSSNARRPRLKRAVEVAYLGCLAEKQDSKVRGSAGRDHRVLQKETRRRKYNDPADLNCHFSGDTDTHTHRHTDRYTHTQRRL